MKLQATTTLTLTGWELELDLGGGVVLRLRRA